MKIRFIPYQFIRFSSFLPTFRPDDDYIEEKSEDESIYQGEVNPNLERYHNGDDFDKRDLILVRLTPTEGYHKQTTGLLVKMQTLSCKRAWFLHQQRHLGLGS